MTSTLTRILRACRIRETKSWIALGVSLVFGAQAAVAQNLAEPNAPSLDDLLRQPVVAASRYAQRLDEVAAAASVITREEIATFGWRTLDEALATLPGFHVGHDRQYNYLGVRGFGVPGDFNTRLLININGNRANDVVYDSGPAGRVLPLDLGLIERIEFIPGSAGSVYRRNAMLGVINVVTRPGASFDGAELAASYETPGAGRQVRASWGKLLANGTDVVMSGTLYDADGRDRFVDFGSAGVAGIARGMDGERDREAFLRVERDPLSFELNYGNRLKQDPTGQYFSDPLVPGQSQRDRYLLTQLSYRNEFRGGRDDVLARLYLGRTNYRGLFEYAGAPSESYGVSSWQGIELRWLSWATAAHRLMLGAELHNDSRRDQIELDPLVGSRCEILGSGWRGGIFAQDEWWLRDTLQATLGLRWDRGDSREVWSPRASMIWKPRPATTVKVLYGRTYREPNAYERDYEDLVSQVANPDLSTETIDTLEFVWEQRIHPRLWVRGSVYHWLMQDFIVLGVEPVSQLSQYQSGAGVTATGIELSLDRTWETGARVHTSLSWQHVSYDRGGRLENSPRLLAKLNATTPLPGTRMRLGYELQYVSRRLSNDGSMLHGYWLSNLALRLPTPISGLELSLEAHNLFNEQYQSPGSDINWQNAIDMDGRSLRLQANWRF